MEKRAVENRHGAQVGDILVGYPDLYSDNNAFFQVVALEGRTHVIMTELSFRVIAFDGNKEEVIPLSEPIDPGVTKRGVTKEWVEGRYVVRYGEMEARLCSADDRYFNFEYTGTYINRKANAVWDDLVRYFFFDIMEGTGFFSAAGKTGISRDLPIEVRYPDHSVQEITIQGLEDGSICLDPMKKFPYYDEEWAFVKGSYMTLRPERTWEELMDQYLSAWDETIHDKAQRIEQVIPRCKEDQEKKDRCLASVGIVDRRATSGQISYRYYYSVEIRRFGSRCPLEEKILFNNARNAAQFIIEKIDAAARSNNDAAKKNDRYYGIMHEYQAKTNKRFVNEWDLIINAYGKALYHLPAFPKKGAERRDTIGMTDSSYMRLGFSSGTLIEMRENPFFTPVKGVILNKIEPGEEVFLGEERNQWLLCIGQIGQIQAVAMEDDHFLSAYFGSDISLPFRQFFRPCGGGSSDQESRLDEMSRMIKKDKKRFWDELGQIAEIIGEDGVRP